MSTDFTIRIVTRMTGFLADIGPSEALDVLVTACDSLVGRHPITDLGTLPRFGRGLDYDGSRFVDVSGIAVVDGRLLVGVGCQNMLEPIRDVDDEEYHLVETRLDRFLTRISRISSGPPGEVVGSVVSENDPRYFEDGGQPLVRCRDGIIRVAWVTPEESMHHEFPWSDTEPRVMLPEVLPADVLTIEEGPRLMADIDVAALSRRFSAINPDPDQLRLGR